MNEQKKYQLCYEDDAYRMGAARYDRVSQDIDSMPAESLYLDVGCGRGEMVERARERGVKAWGLELVPELCDGKLIVHGDAKALPWNDRVFDFVSCYDVVEHLPPEEVDQVVSELFRVCRGVVFVSTNDRSSVHHGEQLHLTRRPRAWWDGKLGKSTTYGVDNGEWHWRIDTRLANSASA